MQEKGRPARSGIVRIERPLADGSVDWLLPSTTHAPRATHLVRRPHPPPLARRGRRRRGRRTHHPGLRIAPRSGHPRCSRPDPRVHDRAGHAGPWCERPGLDRRGDAAHRALRGGTRHHERRSANDRDPGLLRPGPRARPRSDRLARRALGERRRDAARVRDVHRALPGILARVRVPRGPARRAPRGASGLAPSAVRRGASVSPGAPAASARARRRAAGG